MTHDLLQTVIDLPKLPTPMSPCKRLADLESLMCSLSSCIYHSLCGGDDDQLLTSIGKGETQLVGKQMKDGKVFFFSHFLGLLLQYNLFDLNHSDFFLIQISLIQILLIRIFLIRIFLIRRATLLIGWNKKNTKKSAQMVMGKLNNFNGFFLFQQTKNKRFFLDSCESFFS